MSVEESETEESTTSLSDVSSLDDDFVRMDLHSGNSSEGIINDEEDSQAWSEIQWDPKTEVMEDYGLVQETTSAWEDNTSLPIDSYRHLRKNEVIDHLVQETNRYGKQYLQTHEINRRSKNCQ